MYEYLFTEIALNEHDHNIIECEQKQKGGGFDYEQDFIATIEKICTNPTMYRISHKPDKRLLSFTRLPYRILYQVVDKEVHIIAIGHIRKNLKYWNERAASF